MKIASRLVIIIAMTMGSGQSLAASDAQLSDTERLKEQCKELFEFVDSGKGSIGGISIYPAHIPKKVREQCFDREAELRAEIIADQKLKEQEASEQETRDAQALAEKERQEQAAAAAIEEQDKKWILQYLESRRSEKFVHLSPGEKLCAFPGPSTTFLFVEDVDKKTHLHKLSERTLRPSPIAFVYEVLIKPHSKFKGALEIEILSASKRGTKVAVGRCEK